MNKKLKRLALPLLSAAALFLAVAAGSVMLPLSTVLDTLKALICGNELPQSGAIIAHVRLPRIINVFLTGAALSLSGAAMQGLLKNPLADGSTLGVSTGASLLGLEALVEKAEAEAKEQYGLMKKRIQYMYEQGSQSFLELLLESESLADMMNRAD